VRTTFRFSDFDVLEGLPKSEHRPAMLRCWIGDTVALVVEIEPGECADSTRSAAAMLMGAAESIDPKGYEIVLPDSDVAPAEDHLERARRLV